MVRRLRAKGHPRNGRTAGAATLASDVAQLAGNSWVADSSLADKDETSEVEWRNWIEADDGKLIEAAIAL